ncbi:hypothetical protein [Promicromonospora sp. AC04]|uniref:hypothetical protein n=1 Tax=Promicromonospora sp. AC04 TaxID=2135723 RepID=UPI000D3A8A23|nr:hypothetical protein [Promicromonospora sp. AC04]
MAGSSRPPSWSRYCSAPSDHLTGTFLLKGGTYLQHRLGRSAGPTKDVDGIISGDIEFVRHLDSVLIEPWGPLTLERGPVETIETPARVAKPRRFDVRLSIRGKIWRKLQVEIAPEEGSAALENDVLPAPPLDHFGLPSPDGLLGIALRYQIAQNCMRAPIPTTHPRPGTIEHATSSTYLHCETWQRSKA